MANAQLGDPPRDHLKSVADAAREPTDQTPLERLTMCGNEACFAGLVPCHGPAEKTTAQPKTLMLLVLSLVAVISGLGLAALRITSAADKEPRTVVELLEDNTSFFIDNLNNLGADDGNGTFVWLPTGVIVFVTGSLLFVRLYGRRRRLAANTLGPVAEESKQTNADSGSPGAGATSAPLECLAPERWLTLFGETVPPAQREHYERHLESCLACQERLDRCKTGIDGLLSIARQVGEPTATSVDPTLIHVLERLHEMPCAECSTPSEALDLYFLQPADRPELLGMLGAYEVQELIGEGGMGVVLKAFEPALHRPVAIKVLSPALAGSTIARKRFKREGQAAAAVCHNHVVVVYGVNEVAGLPYLVMQYVPGESVQARLDRAGPLELREIICIGLQTASGLAAAHGQGLIHRDIKPANLLLQDGLPCVKITDFGLARMADDVGLTGPGVIAGTPDYMAPEQARGELVDHRADLFSLGSVMYAMCTGRPPFRGSTAVAVLRKVSDDEPAPIRTLNPDIPEWLATLVTRLMAKNPADRLQTAAEVAELLRNHSISLKI